TYSEFTLAEELTIDREGAQLFGAVLPTTRLAELEDGLPISRETMPACGFGVSRNSGVP
ncbi:MAG: hypothetical protein JO022_16620, partial [Acidobacteriaceae bacterium]|nr:hypothetical protein [Acidobacteriaceae bacterium]